MGNGYRTGVGPRNPYLLIPMKNRQWLAAFLGWLDNTKSHNNERQTFKEMAPRCSGNLLMNESSGWAGGFNLGLYSTVMESSIFAPCPAGNCLGSIRIYDALELGCIPIYLRHRFLDDERSMQKPPFPILDSWNDLPEFLVDMRALLACNPGGFEQLQQATIHWWQQTKHRIAIRMQEQLIQLRIEPFTYTPIA
jgi:hypothetical protein